MRRLAPLIPLLLWAASAQAAEQAEVKILHGMVSDWQTDDARARLDPLLAADPQDPDLRFVNGRLAFFEGRYADAVQILDGLLAELGEGAPEAYRQMRDQVVATHDALKDFDEYQSPDGRFLIRYKGRDKLLIPYAMEVLRGADKALSEDFAYRPKGRIVVEIYPEVRYLAAVSPLSEEDLETSGTIALCKYNRLMFTSPRGLVRGYGWRDTLSHEFVHYYVTKVSANTVPIWLHEGIAKFQESRWRLPPGQPLDPPQEDLLARSLKADQLVTFQQMHPSMAKLPSQQAASLAFAEVHTVIDHLHRGHGYDALNSLLSGLRSGDSMDHALKKTYGVDLDGLWVQWKLALRARGLREFPGLVQTSLKFKKPGDEDKEDEPDYGSIEEKKVRDFAHLGELLRARGRHLAAFTEYRKAMALGGEGNPVIQNGAAASLLALERGVEVPPLLERVRSYYPTFLTTYLHLGEAQMQAAQDADAIAAFEEAVGINPFHPLPHKALVDLYTRAGQAEAAARAQKTLELLQ